MLMAFANLEKFFCDNPEFDTVLLASWDASASMDANFYYYSEISMDRGTFIARRGETPVLVANPLNYSLAKEKFSGEVLKFSRGEYAKTLVKELSRSNRIAFSKSSATVSFYDNARKAAKGELVDASEEFSYQRAKKTEAEISAIRKAAGIARKAYSEFSPSLGVTEEEAKRQLWALILESGAEASFRPIVAFGDNARFPHAESGARKLKSGDIILADFGAKVGGYCSDHTRCMFAGEPARKQAEAYEKLQAIFKDILKEIRPGRRVAEITAKYREYLHCSALDFPSHSLGHGIGLEVHEYPSFADSSEDVVREDSVLAIEPSTYYSDFGARFEETVLVTKSGAKII